MLARHLQYGEKLFRRQLNSVDVSEIDQIYLRTSDTDSAINSSTFLKIQLNEHDLHL